MAPSTSLTQFHSCRQDLPCPDHRKRLHPQALVSPHPSPRAGPSSHVSRALTRVKSLHPLLRPQDRRARPAGLPARRLPGAQRRRQPRPLAHLPPRRRQGQLHGLDRHGQARHGELRKDAQARHSGAVSGAIPATAAKLQPATLLPGRQKKSRILTRERTAAATTRLSSSLTSTSRRLRLRSSPWLCTTLDRYVGRLGV